MAVGPVGMTPEQSTAWQRGKLDCRCRQCGWTSAATSRCNRCHFSDLDYSSHEEQQGGKGVYGKPVTLWCQMRAVPRASDKRPRKRKVVPSATTGTSGADMPSEVADP